MLEARPQHPPISRRELEVARAYTGGKTYREIAEDLHIAPATVRTHINNIYRKLKVTSKIELLHCIDAAPAAIPSAKPRKRLILLIAMLALATFAGAFMMTADRPSAPPAPPAQSIALVAFQHDGNPAMRDTLLREMVDGLSTRAEMFVIIPSNSRLTLSAENYARRLSDGIDIRFVLLGKTASHAGKLVASAALYDRTQDRVVWQHESQSPERNSLAIRVSLLDSLSRAIELPEPGQTRRRCLEMIESDTHVFKDGAPAPRYLFRGQNPHYCDQTKAGPH